MALLRDASSRQIPSQSTRSVGSLCHLRPPSDIHTEEGIDLSTHRLPQPGDDRADLTRTTPVDERGATNSCHCESNVGEDQRRGSSAQPHQRPHPGPVRGTSVNYIGAEGNSDASSHYPTGSGSYGIHCGTSQRQLAGHDRHGRRGSPTRVRTTRQPAVTIEKDASMVRPLSNQMGKKMMAMVTMMVTATSSMLAGLHLEGRDGLWEIACAPHSWLSQAAEQQGLKPRRINLQAGYDLYKASSWEQLRHLRRRHRPRKLWFSLPCTKWCQWTQVNYNTPEQRQRLEDDRRRERRLLWFANGFIRETVTEDPDVDIYWEWTFPNHGWRQVPMLDLAAFLEGQEIPWLSCRIDGCRYGLKDTKGDVPQEEVVDQDHGRAVCQKLWRQDMSRRT